MTSFPPPFVDQSAVSGGAVSIPWTDCDCDTPIVQPNIEIRVAQADGGDQNPGESTDVTARATARYNALAWGDIGYHATFLGNVAACQTTGGSSSSSTSGTTTTTTTDHNYNESSEGTVAFQGMRYTLRVNFSSPWVGTQTVKILWRERTVNHTASVRDVSADNNVTGANLSFVTTYGAESASASYAAKSETVSVVNDGMGGSYAQTSLHTIEGTDLSPGDTLSITGPDDLSFLAPQFLATTYEQTASKKGYIAYVVPNGGSGPRAIYTRETASVVPGSPASTPAYSGYQDATAGTNTFANVPRKYESRDYTSTEYDEGGAPSPNQYTADLFFALDLIDQAVSVTPLVTTWPESLRMTLSNEDLTSRITSTVDSALSAHTLSAPGTVAPDGIIAAVRFLPAHEQQYTARKGAYSAQVIVTIFAGVASYYSGQPAPLTSSGTVILAWKQRAIDLDSGAVTTMAGPGYTFSLTGNPGSGTYSATGDTVGGAAIAGPTITGATISVNAPSANQRIEIIDLMMATGTLDCLDIAPQAMIVA